MRCNFPERPSFSSDAGSLTRSSQIFRYGVPRRSPIVFNERLAEVRIDKVLQPHVGFPAVVEGRKELLLRIAANLQQLEVALLVAIPAPLGIQEVALSSLHLVHQSAWRN